MLFPKVVTLASLLVTVFLSVSARPQPGVTRVRHVIHAPIKFRVIHHYKVQKVPIIVKKHVHYVKPEHPKEIPVEEHHPNDIQYEHVDQDGGRHRHVHHFYDTHHEEEEEDDDHRYRKPKPFYHESHYGSHHEDYEDHQQSQETEYEDYEYE